MWPFKRTPRTHLRLEDSPAYLLNKEPDKKSADGHTYLFGAPFGEPKPKLEPQRPCDAVIVRFKYPPLFEGDEPTYMHTTYANIEDARAAYYKGLRNYFTGDAKSCPIDITRVRWKGKMRIAMDKAKTL